MRFFHIYLVSLVLFSCKNTDKSSFDENSDNGTILLDADGDGYTNDEDCDGIQTYFDCDDLNGDTECELQLDLGGNKKLEMVFIPTGYEPNQRYELTNDYYIMKTEVTQGALNVSVRI